MTFLSWHLTFLSGNLTFDIWHLTFDIWYSTFDIQNLTFDIWHLMLISDIVGFDIDILIKHGKIFIFHILHDKLAFCCYFDTLAFWFLHYDKFDIDTEALTFHCLNITDGFCGYQQSKKRRRIPRLSVMDSVVICHGFCGYLSWILWLSDTNIGLRDASASINEAKWCN